MWEKADVCADYNGQDECTVHEADVERKKDRNQKGISQQPSAGSGHQASSSRSSSNAASFPTIPAVNRSYSTKDPKGFRQGVTVPQLRHLHLHFNGFGEGEQMTWRDYYE